jgi:hypothetical protein
VSGLGAKKKKKKEKKKKKGGVSVYAKRELVPISPCLLLALYFLLVLCFLLSFLCLPLI